MVRRFSVEQFLDLRAELLRRKAELAPLARDIHLQQHIRPRTVLGGDALDVAGDVERVHAVEELKERQRVADLVALEMADEMPACAARHERDFCPRLLHAALAENGVPRGQRRAHGLRRVRL